MKKRLLPILFFLSICELFCNCNYNSLKIEQKQYHLTLNYDQFDPNNNTIKSVSKNDTIMAQDDTLAYLKAVDTFYHDKIKERAKMNFGQPKSFSITDKNGLDLTIKLSNEITGKIKGNVESKPEIKKMLDDYTKDSLYVDAK